MLYWDFNISLTITVIVQIIDKVYEVGRKVADDFKKQ
jgi:hypothetical protein